MLIDYQKKPYDEIKKLEDDLRARGYREFYGYLNIAEFWQDMQKQTVYPCYGKFNDKFVILEGNENYTEDDIYKFIIGKTKAEHILCEKRWHEEYERKEREWQAKIPAMVYEYRKKGHEIIDRKYWQLWDECVPIRLKDLYHGFDLDTTLELIAMRDASNEELKEKMFNQGHSNMSFCLVKQMFRVLSDRGKEFYDWYENESKK